MNVTASRKSCTHKIANTRVVDTNRPQYGVSDSVLQLVTDLHFDVYLGLTKHRCCCYEQKKSSILIVNIDDAFRMQTKMEGGGCISQAPQIYAHSGKYTILILNILYIARMRLKAILKCCPSNGN